MVGGRLPIGPREGQLLEAGAALGVGQAERGVPVEVEKVEEHHGDGVVAGGAPARRFGLELGPVRRLSRPRLVITPQRDKLPVEDDLV